MIKSIGSFETCGICSAEMERRSVAVFGFALRHVAHGWKVVLARESRCFRNNFVYELRKKKETVLSLPACPLEACDQCKASQTFPSGMSNFPFTNNLGFDLKTI